MHTNEGTARTPGSKPLHLCTRDSATRGDGGRESAGQGTEVSPDSPKPARQLTWAHLHLNLKRQN